MSRRRNRHRSLSQNSSMSGRSHPQSPNIQDKNLRSTSQSFYLTHRSQRHLNFDLQASEQLFNKNISFFRDNFNQNDPSQLPFMCSLRQGQIFAKKDPKHITLCFPFENAAKNTCNQLIKKRISDFGQKQTRLSGAYYRWHNKSGLNNKFNANFQCKLRDYGQDKQHLQKNFHSYIKPIVYNDIQQAIYSKQDLICTKRSKSFKIK